MKSRVLRYLCLFMVAVATMNCSADNSTEITEVLSNTLNTEYSAFLYEAPISDLTICRPRQLSVVFAHRHYTSSKRQNSSHRNNCDFIKSGKVINTEIINFTLTSNLIVYSSFTKPASRLAALGKLII